MNTRTGPRHHHRPRRRPWGIAAAVLSSAFVWAAGVRAEGPAAANTIAVAGAATVRGRPTVVVITGSLSGEAELAADASVKFADARKKAMAALAALHDPAVSVESLGSTVEQGGSDQQNMNRFNGVMVQSDGSKPRVRITEQLKLTLRDVDKLEPEKLMAAVLKVVDASRDAGLSIGPPPPRNYYEMQMQSQSGAGLASFKIADVTPLQDQAMKAAVDDARRRAQRLADVAGVRLGRIVSVQEQGGSSSESRTVYYGNTDVGVAPVTKEASSTALADIPITAKVYVQFEIGPAAPAPGK